MKNVLLALGLALSLAVPVAAQVQVQAKSINFGNGNVVTETSGTGVPLSSCTGLARYIQTDAPVGASIWQCVSGTMVRQSGSSATISWKGPYSTTTTYSINDTVSFAVSGVTNTYISTTASNLNHEPDTSPTFWSLMVQGSSATDSTARSAATAAQTTASAALPAVGGTGTPKVLSGQLYADQYQSGSGTNDGITMSVTQCVSLPYACQVLAPATYALTELPAWTRAAISATIAQEPSLATGLSHPLRFVDQRAGGTFETVINPAGISNVTLGSQLKTDFTAAISTPAWENFIGKLYAVNLSQNGVHSQLYDFANQSALQNLYLLTSRNSSSASSSMTNVSQCLAPGDCVGEQIDTYGPAGNSAPFDEAIETWSNITSTTINVYRGTLTGSPSPGSTALVVAPSSPVGGTNEAIAGTQGENRWMLDTQSGKVTSFTATALGDDVQPFTATGTNCLGTACNYFTQVTTSTTQATSTGYGYLTSAVTTPANHTAPGQETFSINVSGGSFTTGLACLADERGTGFNQHDGNFETIAISTVSGANITATMQKSHPIGGTIWQGGLCGQFAEIVGADLPSGTTWSNGEGGGTTAYPVRYVWPVLGSLDGTHIILWTGRNEWGALDASWTNYSNKTINLYRGAEVYKVVGANNDTTDNHFALAPNSAAWATGDSVEESQYGDPFAHVGYWSQSNFLPHQGGAGLLYQLMGRVENNDTGITIANLVPPTQYSNDGGAWRFPAAAFYAQGVWGYPFFYNGEPANSLVGWSGGVANQTTTLIQPGFGGAVDNFWYKADAGGSFSGGTWGIRGNMSVFGQWSPAFVGAPTFYVDNPPQAGIGILRSNCNLTTSCSSYSNGYDVLLEGSSLVGTTNSDVVRYYPTAGGWLWTANTGGTTPMAMWYGRSGWPAGIGPGGGWFLDAGALSGAANGEAVFGFDKQGNIWTPSGEIPVTNKPVSVPSTNAPYTNATFACTSGQGGVAGLNIVNGVIVAAPTCDTTPAPQDATLTIQTGGAGTGATLATPACVTGYRCTQYSGTVQFTSGSVVGSAGSALLEISWTTPFAHKATCVGVVTAGGAATIPFFSTLTGSTTTAFIAVSTTLTINTTYYVEYHCGAN